MKLFVHPVGAPNQLGRQVDGELPDGVVGVIGVIGAAGSVGGDHATQQLGALIAVVVSVSAVIQNLIRAVEKRGVGQADQNVLKVKFYGFSH
jgi:hypothetical protein